jgi:hypothetical protein
MNINQYILDFLADAQYRVAELAGEILELKNGGYGYEVEEWERAQLILWMDLLYESRDSIWDWYNYLGKWTDKEIKQECEYLRKLSGMSKIPWLTFSAYAPDVVNVILGGGTSANFPTGNSGDILLYDTDGLNPTPTHFPEEGGMTDEITSITEYFTR